MKPTSRRPPAPAAPEERPRLVFTPPPDVAAPKPPTIRRGLALTAIVLGSSLAFIDGTIVSVALPAIQGDLKAQPSQIQWVANGYLLALGALVLVGGAAGDRYGRKRLFIAGVAIFTLASLLCGAVWTVENLIAARVLQGIGAALMVPTALALIPVCWGERERGRALGIWAGASALATALGPVLGGWLVDEAGWRWVFLINGPVALVAVLLALVAIPENRDDRAEPPDWAGAVLASAMLGLLGWALSGATEWGLASLRFVGAMAAAVAAFVLFVIVERRLRAPMLPLEMFRYRAFTGVNLLTFALYLAMSGAIYLLPFEWMRVDGFSAVQTGVALLPFSAVIGIGSPLAGRAADALGPRPFLVIGPLLAAAGCVLLIFPAAGADYWTGWFPGLLVLSLGMAVTVAPLTAALFASADEDRAGLASGINNAAARVGGMVAVALLTLVLSLTFAAMTDLGLEEAGRRLAAVMGGGGFEAAVSADEKAAFRRGFQVCMGVAAGFAALAGLVAAFTIPPGRPDHSAA